MTIKEVRITFGLGASVEIDGQLWARPYASANVLFDGLPSDEELDAGWAFLGGQVEEQLAGLLEVVRRSLKTVPPQGGWRHAAPPEQQTDWQPLPGRAPEAT